MSATARASCKEISPQCPVEFTPLGYFPNLGANIFFCCCFGIFFLVAFVVGVWKKTWTFTFALISIAACWNASHAALAVGPGISRIKPYLYTWIFIPCDISCLVLQGIGGGVAASGDQKNDKSLLDNGNRIIMAGIGLQVGVLSLFGIVALDYYWRVSRYHRTSVSTDGEREAWRDGKFRNFAGAVSIAYLTIYARCVYRIAEMAGGWG
ncbi:predicted protein [Histoplasma mississippiense (nom. inval.)]|uniref:predicted protein n=1 Tax=Ajellomyces capsulatus (strain NAm1 / WU24) TaxID=2059318 RepID=UPI000157B782|nr:predicted protein [Histoplasma mississippiense (nom. inval.)]EDN04110.1 predicted protein [Histoplasma mississippiense (nom. inval.)]